MDDRVMGIVERVDVRTGPSFDAVVWRWCAFKYL
jgi:hypothetical protein